MLPFEYKLNAPLEVLIFPFVISAIPSFVKIAVDSLSATSTLRVLHVPEDSNFEYCPFTITPTDPAVLLSTLS